jgi:hypothetical protein
MFMQEASHRLLSLRSEISLAHTTLSSRSFGALQELGTTEAPCKATLQKAFTAWLR